MKRYKYLLVIQILLVSAFCYSQGIDKQLPSWEEGIMDIHHINTGRGDAAFAILPDGTTLLIDAGDMSETHPRTLSARNAPRLPNTNKTAPEWIVDYMHQFFPKGYKKQLDYALITHYHDDHFGELDSLRIKAENGDYRLTGITEVGNKFPIHKILDRGFTYPINLRNPEIQNQERFQNDAYGMVPTLKNYWKFLSAEQTRNGLVHEQLIPGQNNQIALVNKAKKYHNFNIRNIAVNGTVWTGVGNDTLSLFSKGEYPGENNLSTCIKISYGKFDYFTGGDISGVNGIGATDDNSVESHIAPVIGAVDVATLNHHGNRDSQNDVYVRTLRPRVWIQQNWSSDHPGDEVLRRITSKELYPGERDIFSNVMLQANKDVIGGRLNQYKSQNGHIVLRVYPNGNSYAIFVLDDTTDKREITAKFGPYEAR
ncbi:metallo-beta-lactamase superfamily protein [Maribacter caenipelagi]|uniref:Metallo-beta-lactamase superfamily protein n=1 Tax=Maribacter caenipelagi TaxID=1447781 RepID=A0A4R7D8T2_9FLAO|nr:MBL fold metallo-hydrolase [Maribacter caenipelagi]TDS16651.1 metallo-beta-lactamase superfamily protein [Maribacter caenipelagi]